MADNECSAQGCHIQQVSVRDSRIKNFAAAKQRCTAAHPAFSFLTDFLFPRLGFGQLRLANTDQLAQPLAVFDLITDQK
jgi:hypothetical protein